MANQIWKAFPVFNCCSPSGHGNHQLCQASVLMIIKIGDQWHPLDIRLRLTEVAYLLKWFCETKMFALHTKIRSVTQICTKILRI